MEREFGIGERDLLIGRGQHLLLVGRELAHLLLELGELLPESQSAARCENPAAGDPGMAPSRPWWKRIAG